MPKKINTDDTAIQKRIRLFFLLCNAHRSYSLTELSEYLECSKATTLRCLADVAKYFSCAITEERKGNASYYYVPDQGQTFFPKITLDSLSYLIICYNFLKHLLPEDIQTEIKNAFMQTSSSITDLPEAEKCVPPHLAMGLAFMKGRIDYSTFGQIINTLMESIQYNKICRMSYKHPQKGTIEYIFAPINIIYRDSLAVHGWILESESKPVPKYPQMTRFMIHRFLDVRTLETTWQNLPKISKEAQSTFGVFPGNPFNVKIEFSSNVAEYIKERSWSDPQEIQEIENGRILLSFWAKDLLEVLSWVLSFGKNAKVLSPQKLVNAIKENVLEIQNLYS